MKLAVTGFALTLLACRSTPVKEPARTSRPAQVAGAASSPPSSPPVVAAIEASPPPEPETPKGVVIGEGTRVLLFGDSMVKAGLGFRLAQLVKERGGIYLEDYWTSSSTKRWSEGERLDKLMSDTKPDVVFIVIGSNEVFLMDKMAAANVKKIVGKLNDKPCVWIGPPVWSHQNGIVEVERDNSEPSAFFDSSDLKLDRQWDKIHPNARGGAHWANALWEATVAPAPAS